MHFHLFFAVGVCLDVCSVHKNDLRLYIPAVDGLLQYHTENLFKHIAAKTMQKVVAYGGKVWEIVQQPIA